MNGHGSLITFSSLIGLTFITTLALVLINALIPDLIGMMTDCFILISYCCIFFWGIRHYRSWHSGVQKLAKGLFECISLMVLTVHIHQQFSGHPVYIKFANSLMITGVFLILAITVMEVNRLRHKIS